MQDSSTNRERAGPFRGHRHYFHAATSVARWRTRLSALALVLSVGWIASRAVDKEERYADVSHGPLIEAHGTWSHRCDVCHIPFGEPGNTSGGLMDCRERWRAFRCNSCHPGSSGDAKNYAPHYTAAHWKNDAKSRDCSSCHHDHQGRNFALSRPSDSTCVRCHRDLNRLREKDAPSGSFEPATEISAFHGNHPEFRVLNKERPPNRSLKFNHGLHMAVGLTSATGKVNPNALFNLADVDPKFADQYLRFADPNGNPASPVHLDCSACHHLDTGRELGSSNHVPGLPTELTSPARPAGAYYLPITFEKHCQACHSLNVTGWTSSGGLKVTGFDLPHRLQPDEVDRRIRGEIARQVIKQDKFQKVPLPPNERLDPRATQLPESLRAETEKIANHYSRLVFDRGDGPSSPLAIKGGYACLKCHTAQFDNPQTARPKSIDATSARTIWMPNGRFDHTAHRVVDCKECHKMWDEPGKVKPLGMDWSSEPANLPSIAKCQECHAPQSRQGGRMSGGVRHGCVDCHRYHGADHPLQGPGSPHRGPKERFDIGTFLRGPRPKEGGR